MTPRGDVPSGRSTGQRESPSGAPSHPTHAGERDRSISPGGTSIVIPYRSPEPPGLLRRILASRPLRIATGLAAVAILVALLVRRGTHAVPTSTVANADSALLMAPTVSASTAAAAADAAIGDSAVSARTAAPASRPLAGVASTVPSASGTPSVMPRRDASPRPTTAAAPPTIVATAAGTLAPGTTTPVATAPTSAAPSTPAASVAAATVPATPPSTAPDATTPPATVSAGASSEAEARVGVGQAVAAYASSINARDVAGIERAYPGLTAAERASWTSFFRDVSGLDARLGLQETKRVRADVIEGRVTGEYEYTTTRPRRSVRRPVTFQGVFERDSGGSWRLTTIR
jgi:hypothetical protein